MISITKLLHILGAVGTAAGLFAYLMPLAFFKLLADYTGEPNLHLGRDVGAAYLTAGIALWWSAFAPAWRGPLITTTALFLSFHAIGHVIDLAAGEVALSHILADAIQVFIPALVVSSLAVHFLRMTPAENQN